MLTTDFGKLWHVSAGLSVAVNAALWWGMLIIWEAMRVLGGAGCV